jgi:hypothetical protein
MKVSRNIAIAILVLTLGQVGVSQWINIGPNGGNVRATLTTGTTLLIAVPAVGVYRSTDQGTSWNLENQGLPSEVVVTAFCTAGTSVLAGTAGKGTFRSTDQGISWVPVNAGLPSNDASFVVNTLLSAGPDVFIGSDRGVYRSTNGGSLWLLASTGLTNLGTFSLTVHGLNLLAATDGGIYLTTNQGTQWQSVLYGVAALAFVDDPPGLIVSTTWNGVYRTTDDGQTWSSMNRLVGTPVSTFTRLTDTIFGGSPGGIHRSTDHGNQWIPMNNGLDSAQVQSISSSGSALYAGTAIGLFKSGDGGESWLELTAGLPREKSFALGKLDSSLFARTESGLYRSTDDGDGWQLACPVSPPDHTPVPLSSMVTFGDLIVFDVDNRVYRSTDRGVQWTVTAADPRGGLGLMVAKGESLFIAVAGSGVFRSGDSGATWGRCHVAFTSWGLASNQTSVFAGDEDYGPYRSTDDGITWTQKANGLPADYIGRRPTVTAIATIGDTVFIGCRDWGGIYRSVNNGEVWVPVAGISQINVFAIDPEKKFLGRNSGGVYQSTDGGIGWFNVAEGMPLNLPILDLLLRDGYLFAATSAGIWRRPIDEMVVAAPGDDSPQIPLGPSLSQNYPNPFNPETRISYTVNRNLLVTVTVHDMLGRIVATLRNEITPPGIHELRWDGTNHASGIYVCRMKAGEYTSSIKLLLMK